MQMELFNTYQDHIPTEENVAEFIEEKVIPPYWNMTTEQRQQVSFDFDKSLLNSCFTFFPVH